MKIVAFAMLFTLLLIGINTLANSDNQRRLFDRSSVVRGPLSVAPLSTTDHGPLTTNSQPRSAFGNRQSQLQKSAIRNPQSPLVNRPVPWYEKVLKRINPAELDYGAWFEERRRIFLEATVLNPYFWYSFWVTLALIITILVYSKHRSDFHRFTWMSAGWMADFYNEMEYARDHAGAAIEKYNQHVEKCNRAIEAELDGSWKQQSHEEAEEWKQKYLTLCKLIDEKTSENKKLADTNVENQRVIADMSLRLENLEQKLKGKPVTPADKPLSINESNKLLVNRINALEMENRNYQSQIKRLTGGR